MTKNRPSRQRLTGYTDSAYEAGTPSSSTRIVDPTVDHRVGHERAPAREHQAELRQSRAEHELRRPGLGRGLGLEGRDHHPQNGDEERDRHDPREDAPACPPRHLAEPARVAGHGPHRHGGHTPASSNWKTRANKRSANVATMIVRMTVITPAAAAPPTLNAKFTCWYR